MITIVKRPEQFTPSHNPIIYQVTSDNPNLVYNKLRLIEDDTIEVVSECDIFPTPQLPQGSYINMSRLLDDIVHWELDNQTQLVKGLSRPVKAYRVRMTERIHNPTTMELEDGASYDVSSDVNYVFYGGIERSKFREYTQSKYVVNGSAPVSFLTTKPNFSNVNMVSAEHLYFLKEPSVSGLTARVRFYDSGGVLLNTVTQAVSGSQRMFRLNISPKALKNAHGIDFTNVHFYTVDVVDGSTVKVNARTYYYQDLECGLEYVNVLWFNPLGGLDSYTFIAPVESNKHKRVEMKRNIFGVDEAGIYDDTSQNIYNPSEVILGNKPQTFVKVTSKHLSDAEAYWLQGLYASKQTFVELNNSYLVSTVLTETIFDIPRLRYVRDRLNTIQIELQLTEGIGPDASYILTGDTTPYIAPSPSPTPTMTATPAPTATPGLTPSSSPTPTPTPSLGSGGAALDLSQYSVNMNFVGGVCQTNAEAVRTLAARDAHVSDRIHVVVHFTADNGCNTYQTFEFFVGETIGSSHTIMLDCGSGPCTNINYTIESVAYIN